VVKLNYRTITIKMADETDEQSYFYCFVSSGWSNRTCRSERKSFKAICKQIDKQINNNKQVPNTNGMLIPIPTEVKR
jgi:hypothetical protein